MVEDVDFFEAPDEAVGAEKFKADITNLAKEVKTLESGIADLAVETKKLMIRKNEIEGRLLPDLLHQAGVSEITTLDGIKVSTKFIVGAIPAQSKDEAYDWMDENGHSDIIKRNLALKFDKGAVELAEKARQQLVDMGFEPEMKMDIHPQTFMAFAREQLKTGKMLPLDKWGVFYGDKAVIK